MNLQTEKILPNLQKGQSKEGTGKLQIRYAISIYKLAKKKI